MPTQVLIFTPEDFRAVIREEVERAISGPQATRLYPEPKYLTIAQAAEKYDLSKSHLYTLSSRQAVTTRKVGRAVHFLAEDLERHFNGKTKRSLNGIDTDLNTRGVFPTLKQRSRG